MTRPLPPRQPFNYAVADRYLDRWEAHLSLSATGRATSQVRPVAADGEAAVAAPAKRHRSGRPVPLDFHLGTAAAAYLQATLVAANAAKPTFPWHADLGGFDGPAPKPMEVVTAAVDRLQAMLAGISAWQSHPFERPEMTAPVLWSEGSTRLLDYGQTPQATEPQGPVVLVVPSMINTPDILDLLPECSALRTLAAAGMRPLLLDWGPPGFAEAGMNIDTYLDRRLRPALAVAEVLGGCPPAVLGYCMGGTLAAGAVLAGARARALVTIGAPWDFGAVTGSAAHLRASALQGGSAQARAGLRSLADAFGLIPDALFQYLFSLVDPMQAARKFRAFAAMPQDGFETRRFVALEDWLAQGVAMSGPAAEALLIDWHLHNTPMRGDWPAGALNPEPIPTLTIMGRRDTIAQPEVAAGLRTAMPWAEELSPDLGHVGMVVGSGALRHVWQPAIAFLLRDA